MRNEKKATFAPAFEKQRNHKDDSVAQQVEHIPFKDGVLGSNPSWVTKRNLKFTKTLEINAFQAFFHITVP